MKVLHVYRTYFPDPQGGLQEAIRQIALSTKYYGVDSNIFTLSEVPQPAQCIREEGVVFRARSWVEIASCNLGSLNAFTLFAELANQADLIHYHFPWPFADLMHLTVRPLAPAIMTYHSDVVRQKWLSALYSPLMNMTLASMKAIVATSLNYAKTSAVLSAPAHCERVSVIPLGIEEKSYQQLGDEDVFNRIGLKKGVPFFLFIGVLRYYKGLHCLVQAASHVDAPIVIAGLGTEWLALQAQVKWLGLKNVIFAGQITEAEKVSLIEGCCALVLPSHLRSEAFGMVLVEAAMFGKPMVSCEIGTGTSFVNLDSETGFVIPPDDPVRLANAMNTFLSDSHITSSFGRAARLRYEKLFSGEALGRSYTALYRNVLR